jgi:hypothetical protein
MDIDSIPIGVDFRSHIAESLAHCHILLAVIGPEWLGITPGGTRRIDDPNDFVRLEVAQALTRNIRVVPLLVEDADMPAHDELPEDLKSLAFRNALRVDSGVDFHHHINRLCDAIGTGDRSSKRVPDDGHAHEETAEHSTVLARLKKPIWRIPIFLCLAVVMYFLGTGEHEHSTVGHFFVYGSFVAFAAAGCEIIVAAWRGIRR